MKWVVYEAIRSQSKTAAQIAAEIGISRDATSHHLKEMIDAQKVVREKTGSAYAYRAADPRSSVTFDRKPHTRAKPAAKHIGRCDVAASWITKTEGLVYEAE